MVTYRLARENEGFRMSICASRIIVATSELHVGLVYLSAVFTTAMMAPNAGPISASSEGYMRETLPSR